MARPDVFLHTDDVEALRRRDLRVIAGEYAAHRDVLARAARRAGFVEGDAHELVQSVWETFLEIVPRFEGRSQVRTFLLGILRREASAARRRRVRAVATDPTTLDDQPWDGADAHGALENARLGRAVRGCVRKLPEVERRAVELKVLEERETEAVGRELGVTANHLGVLLHRARQHLRICLTPHVG